MKKEKIVLGMSGGVDSSVAAILLQKKGFEVYGVFMKNWDDKNAICNAEDDYADAVSVCNQLNIPLKKINYTKEYKERVFSQFLDDILKDTQNNIYILGNGGSFSDADHFCGELSGRFEKERIFAIETN